MTVDEVLRCAGPGCGKPLTRLATGRPPVYCGPNCRKAAQRARAKADDARRQRAAQLADAKATAAAAWGPLEETVYEASELAAAVLAYAAGDDRRDLTAKLTEFSTTARQLEQLAVTYFDATALAARLEDSPDQEPG